MKSFSIVAKGCLAWVLMTQSAMALPGPEVLLPMGAGLFQIAALLFATINLRRMWRKIKGTARLILMLATAWLIVSAHQKFEKSGVNFEMIWAYSEGPRPIQLPFLPDDFSKAIPASPVLGSTNPALRQGGKVVIYLGDPGNYLNQQLQTEGYALRLADWRARREELAAASSDIIYIHESFIEVPKELNSIPITEIPDLISYSPPAPVFWAMVIPSDWMSRDAPSSPAQFPYGIPKIRSIDADGPAEHLQSEKLTLDEVANITIAPRIISESHYRSASNTLHILEQKGLRPEAFVLNKYRLSPEKRPQLNPFTLALLVLFAAASSRFIEHRFRRLRRRRIARRMRKNKGPSHGLDTIWTLAPLPATLFFCGATYFLALSPSLWAWNSPPAYSVNAWLSPALLLISTILWMYRAARLPPLQRQLSHLMGMCMLFYLVRSGEIYLGHLAFPLLLFLSCMVGALCVPTRGKGWALLRSNHGGMGSKAADLQHRFPRSRHIAEGLVIWPDDADDPVRIIESEIGSGRTILRSTAQDERESYGSFTSIIAEGDDIKTGLNTVLDSYGENPGRAVLCMPYIPGTHSGVARLDLSGIQVEIGTGSDGVTAGHATIGQAHWHRHSRRTVTQPHFGLMAELKRWEQNKPLLVEWVGPWIVQCTKAPWEEGWFGHAWRSLIERNMEPCTLQRTGEESLASPSGERTVEFWHERWTKKDAFGRALQTLQLPRLLVPDGVLLPIGGALYVHGGRWQLIENILWLRSHLPGWQAGQILQDIWASSDPENLDRLIQNSISLRMLQPYLPNVASDLPPAPSTRFQQHPHLFPHRAAFDLDWGVPRNGEGIGPVQTLGTAPENPGQEACAYLRDWTHDCICRHISRTQQEDPTWLEQEVCDVSPPFGTITPTDLENRKGSWHEQAFWIGESCDVDGTVSDVPGPGHILYLENPRPDLLQDGFEAIVCKHGGRYSHAALVCSQRGLRALFGTGASLTLGDRVHLTTSGDVVTTAEE